MSMRTVVVNAEKMNFDDQLDFSDLSETVDVYASSDEAEFLMRIAEADVVVTKECPVTAEMIADFPDSVKLIVEAGTGYNNIDLQAAERKGIAVCNVPAYSTARVAHTAIMLILNLASSMRRQIGMLAHGDRRNFTAHLSVSHTEVNGKTLGIVGLGNIGRETASIAKALGMKVLAYTRTPKSAEDGIEYVDFERLLGESDYLSLHCALNEETKHIINEAALRMMKPTAYVVNTARGALIDEAALIRALREGRIAGAGLDVQDVEPPAADNPLYEMENVVLTPHIGWKGLETRRRLVDVVRENIASFGDGTPINRII